MTAAHHIALYTCCTYWVWQLFQWHAWLADLADCHHHPQRLLRVVLYQPQDYGLEKLNRVQVLLAKDKDLKNSKGDAAFKMHKTMHQSLNLVIQWEYKSEGLCTYLQLSKDLRIGVTDSGDQLGEGGQELIRREPRHQRPHQLQWREEEEWTAAN